MRVYCLGNDVSSLGMLFAEITYHQPPRGKPLPFQTSTWEYDVYDSACPRFLNARQSTRIFPKLKFDSRLAVAV
jgi:hypothetical protein